MPYCPQCRSEYRSDIKTCATCEVPLVAELPKSPTMGDEDQKSYFAGKQVELVTQGYVAVCQEVQGLLEGGGVPARIVPLDDEGTPIHAMFRLEIARDDLDKARQILGARWKASLAAEGVEHAETKEAVLAAGSETECPACGAKFTPQSTETAECPDCGLFLGVPG